jgi:hypothetical protein
MTPNELFKELVTLYPTAWPEDTRNAWAKRYAEALKGITPEVLAEAYSATMKVWKSQKPPQPGSILEHIKSTPTNYSGYYKTEPAWPYAKMANQAVMGHKAVDEGWGLDLWEFIAKQGRNPSLNEELHLMKTNDRFWVLYNALQNGTEVEFDTVHGPKMMRVPERTRGLFEAFVRKRERIVERFSQVKERTA